MSIGQGPLGPYLHCHQSIIDEDFFGEEIGSDSRLIASAELLIDLFHLNRIMLAGIENLSPTAVRPQSASRGRG
jgi:hypothetical protein